jgi:PAS domain S-box-containing protein
MDCLEVIAMDLENITLTVTQTLEFFGESKSSAAAVKVFSEKLENALNAQQLNLFTAPPDINCLYPLKNLAICQQLKKSLPTPLVSQQLTQSNIANNTKTNLFPCLLVLKDGRQQIIALLFFYTQKHMLTKELALLASMLSPLSELIKALKMDELNTATNQAINLDKQLAMIENYGQVGIWQRSRDLSNCYWSKQTYKILGFRPLQLPLLSEEVELMDVRDKDRFIKAFNESFRSGKLNIQVKIHTFHGPRIIAYHATLDHNTTPPRLFGVIKDNTEAVNSTLKLIETEMNYSLILKHIIVPVVGLNPQGNILFINNAALNALGYERSELIGEHFSILLHHRSHEVENAFTNEHSKNEYKSSEVELQKENGSTFPAIINTINLKQLAQQQNTIVSVICIRDLSDSRFAEQLLNKSSKFEGMQLIASGMSHDFNNVLNVIGGNMELLLNKKFLNQDYLTKKLSSMKNALERGKHLNKQLLAMGTDDRQKLSLVNLSSFLRQHLELLQDSVRNTLAIIYDLPENLAPIYVNTGELLDVLINLFVNAKDATLKEKSPELTIRCQQLAMPMDNAQYQAVQLQENFICLSIKDNGQGVKQTLKQKITEPFFTTKENKGSGLGLCMVTKFIEKNKGHLEIISSENEGFEIKLFFPVYQQQNAQSQSLAAPLESDLLPAVLKSEVSTLLIEDESELREIICEMLTNNGYRVKAVANASKALKELSHEEYQLVITDIGIPGALNGLNLEQYLNAHHPKIKRVLISGFSDDTLDELGIEQRQKSLLLKKPFNEVQLLNTLDACYD